MGIWETFTDLVDAATPWSTAEAEAPPAEEQQQEASKDEPKDDAPEEAEEATEEAEEEEEEEEDEDEDEIKDPKEQLEEECANSKQCAPAKHHYDECVERVTKQQDEEGSAKEDCVEEFFHLAHCATQCAAPKLWSVLK